MTNLLPVCSMKYKQTPTMSEFSKLKQQRKAKESKSYASASQEPEIHPTGPILNPDDGLYPSLPPVLDVRVNEENPEFGRGIFSKFHWKPGE
jgi:hypothetical protein